MAWLAASFLLPAGCCTFHGHRQALRVEPVEREIMQGNRQMLSLLVNGIIDDLAALGDTYPELKWVRQFTRFETHRNPTLASIEFSHLPLRNPLPDEAGREERFFLAGGYAFYIWAWPMDVTFSVDSNTPRWGISDEYHHQLDHEWWLMNHGVKLGVDYAGPVPSEVRQLIDDRLGLVAAMDNYGYGGAWDPKKSIDDCGLVANLFLLRRHEIDGRPAVDVLFSLSNHRRETMPLHIRYSGLPQTPESLRVMLDGTPCAGIRPEAETACAAPWYDRVVPLAARRVFVLRAGTITLPDRGAHTLKATFADAVAPLRAEATLELPALGQ
jgi:hypothetical protein